MNRKLKTCRGCGQQVIYFANNRCKHCATLFKMTGQKDPKKDNLPTELKEQLEKVTKKKNTYSDSDNNRWTQEQIDAKITKAKELKISSFFDEHGYYFCEDCGTSSAFKFDCSHEIPVSEAKNNGTVELAWDIQNIKLRCRKCHQKHDNLA